MNNVLTNLGRWYAQWSVFLSGYAPLALIFAARLAGKSRPIKAWACVGICVALAINVAALLRWFRAAPEDYEAAEVQSGAGELAAYVATYLLPFAVVGDVTSWDLAAYAAFLLLIGIISVRGNFMHLNALLALAGYNIYTVTTRKGRKWLVLSRWSLKQDDRFEARRILDRLLLVTQNRSACERVEPI